MKDLFLKLIFKIGGYGSDPLLLAKMPYILQGLIFLTVFIIIFVYLYHRYFWKNRAAKTMFFWVVGLLSLIVLAKYAINFIAKGYLPDRMIFYGLPSPRAESFWWFILSGIIFAAFLFLRKKIDGLPRWPYLATLYSFFCSFALAVAGIREGFASIADPFTRTYWEYSGNIPLIKSVKYFLENYITLMPQLALHSTVHPPGYSLVLYFFYKIFSVGFLGQAILLVLTAGLVIIPLYYLWVKLFTEIRARKILQIFIFTPGIVMFTATSMDAFLLLVVWVAITLCFLGWKKSAYLAGLGGFAAGVALLSNFLFLLSAPAFLLIIIYIFKTTERVEWRRIFFRILVSAGTFLLFFAGLYFWSHYSIIENFFAARAANQHIVSSNFESLRIYLIYFLMNVVDFTIYLGLPLLLLFISRGKNIFKDNLFFKIGLVNLAFLLVVGVFQGEVERLWLFMVPFFIILFHEISDDENKPLFSATLALLFFQIIVTQVLFFTYW